MAAVISDDLRYRIGRSFEAFPELGDHSVTEGLTSMRGVDGLAVPDETLILLNTNWYWVPFFTIGNEFMHLLQQSGLGAVTPIRQRV